MTLSRRHFLKLAGAVSIGFAGLRCTEPEPAPEGRPDRPGPIRSDPDGVLDLPEGFSYRVLSPAGEEMDDGFLVPAMHDGQAAFPAPDGRTILIRNHEVSGGAEPSDGAFGVAHERLRGLDRSLLFDPGRDDGPALGGCTGVLWDPEHGVVEQWLALAGTLRNCAGGPTPWGSWITCEESVQPADRRHARDHGWAFEVPAERGPGPVRPEPLAEMGRFYREAVAIDPRSGIVYQSEDLDDGLLYRYVPDRPGELAAGGRLQALKAGGRDSLPTQNRDRVRIPEGSTLRADWVDLSDPASPEDDLRIRGFEAGAAQFARAEGMWWGGDSVWIACTSGGPARRGQIWRYRPGPHEGTPREGEAPGVLELFMEASRGSLLRHGDNLTVAPWGDLFVCEDGPGADHLVGVTAAGESYRFARNAGSTGELAGSVFSPDGSTLFLNLQAEGLTLAVTGPWPDRS